MHVVRLLVALMAVALLVGVGGCKKKEGGDKKDKKGGDMAAMDKGDPNKPKLSHKDNPKEGDSCKGLSPTDGRMACDGNVKIFCSSMSKYKWKKLGECKGKTKCVLGAGGKSVSCK